MKIYLKTAAFVCAIMMMERVSAQKLSMNYYPEEKLENKTHSSFSTAESQLTEDTEFRYERVEQSLMDAKKLVIKKISKKTGKRIWEKTVPLDAYDKSTNSYFIDLERIGNGFIIFFKRENSKTKESYITGQLCDDNAKPYGEEEQLATCGFRNDGGLMPLYYKVERQGNRFLLYPDYYFVNDFKNKPYKFTMIDERLKVVYEKEIEFPKDQYYQLHTVKFEENLSFKAVFLVSTNGKKNTDANGLSEYWVANYNHPASDFKTEPINFNKKFKYFGNDLADFDSQSGTLIISGQYHQTEKNKGYQGIFNIRYNLSTMETENVQLIEYTQDLKNEMIGKKKQAKGKLPASFSIQNQYVNAASDVTYVLEEMGSYTVKANDNGSSSAFDKTTHWFGNIILIKTNAKGEITWFKTIVRSASDPYTTYTPTYSYESGDYTLLLFNTSATTAKTPDPENGYVYSEFENMLMVIVFDKGGNIVTTESFAPKVSKGMSCNMQNIREMPDKTVEVSFDKVSKTYKLESITRAVLDFVE